MPDYTYRDPRHMRMAWQMSKGGMSRREIAEQLGYPETTINNWINRGNALYRDAVRKMGKEGSWT